MLLKVDLYILDFLHSLIAFSVGSVTQVSLLSLAIGICDVFNNSDKWNVFISIGIKLT